MSSARPSRPSVALALSLGLVMAFLLGELLVRAAGIRPWRRPVDASRPPVALPDPILGWRNKPGRHELRLPFGETPSVAMTFWENGARASGPRQSPRGEHLLLLGCSFTQGWAVPDSETFGWLLQERFPAIEVVNLGTAAYGTYQSLLALQRHSAEAHGAPRLVVYGFYEEHAQRNVAPFLWLRALSAVSRRGTILVPYALLRDGALEGYPPIGYPTWPFHGSLASVTLLEARVKEASSRKREAQAGAVTEALLVEMQRVARESESKLLVAVLASRPAGVEPYTSVMRRSGIEYVDCRHPDFGAPAMRVRGDGHPNGAMNAHWARCIGDAVARALPVGPPAAR